MNGATESRSLILQNMDDRLRQVEKQGCTNGQVRAERLRGMELEMKDIKDILIRLDGLLRWGILIVVILAFLAGVNTWGEILKFFVR